MGIEKIGAENYSNLDRAGDLADRINALEEKLEEAEKNWQLADAYRREYEDKLKKEGLPEEEKKRTKIALSNVTEKLKEFGDLARKNKEILGELKDEQGQAVKKAMKEDKGRIN